MTKMFETIIDGQDQVGCCGLFDALNNLCKSRCALRLKCCSEKNKNTRLEILEDLVASEEIHFSNH